MKTLHLHENCKLKLLPIAIGQHKIAIVVLLAKIKT